MPDMYGVSVQEFGAVGDGETDDAAAFQAAIDSGSPRVVVPSGLYKLGRGLRLGSDLHLLAHAGAVITYADGAGKDEDDFLLTNKDFERGNANIRIEGGIWNGNNPGNPRGPDAPRSYSGVMINFTNVSDLTLRDMTLIDAESYFVRFGRVRSFLVERIRFDIKSLRPNQDGIHISGHCSDGIVRHIQGMGLRTPNDDMVALLADDALHRAQNLNGAFNGPIARVRVENLRASSCHSFIRLLSVDHTIDDVEINDVEGGCICSAINMDGCRDCRVKLFKEEDRPGGVGAITNVSISDFRVFKAADQSRQPLIDFRTRVDGFRVERFERVLELDSSPKTPTLQIEKSGGLDVSIEDFCAHALDAGEIHQLRMPSEREAVRAVRHLGAEESFTLSKGGFGLLKADKAKSI